MIAQKFVESTISSSSSYFGAEESFPTPPSTADSSLDSMATSTSSMMHSSSINSVPESFPASADSSILAASQRVHATPSSHQIKHSSESQLKTVRSDNSIISSTPQKPKTQSVRPPTEKDSMPLSASALDKQQQQRATVSAVDMKLRSASICSTASTASSLTDDNSVEVFVLRSHEIKPARLEYRLHLGKRRVPISQLGHIHGEEYQKRIRNRVRTVGVPDWKVVKSVKDFELFQKARRLDFISGGIGHLSSRFCHTCRIMSECCKVLAVPTKELVKNDETRHTAHAMLLCYVGKLLDVVNFWCRMNPNPKVKCATCTELLVQVSDFLGLPIGLAYWKQEDVDVPGTNRTLTKTRSRQAQAHGPEGADDAIQEQLQNAQGASSPYLDGAPAFQPQRLVLDRVEIDSKKIIHMHITELQTKTSWRTNIAYDQFKSNISASAIEIEDYDTKDYQCEFCQRFKPLLLKGVGVSVGSLFGRNGKKLDRVCGWISNVLELMTLQYSQHDTCLCQRCYTTHKLLESILGLRGCIHSYSQLPAKKHEPNCSICCILHEDVVKNIKDTNTEMSYYYYY